jgi:hypothetical protein
MSVVPHPRYFATFPRLKIKLKGRHLYTIEVLEAESQAVPNTLTKYGFQKALKMAEALGPAHMHRTADGRTSPGNYGWLFVPQQLVSGLPTRFKDWMWMKWHWSRFPASTSVSPANSACS